MPQLVNHWTVVAFEDNIQPIAELIVLLKLVPANVGGICYGKSLFRAMSSARDLSVADVSLMQDVAVVQDFERGVFVNVVKASGTDETFEKVRSKMKAASQKFPGKSNFEKGYPFKPPVTGMKGKVKGVYSDLEVLAGIVVDPSKDNEVITRPSDGMFCWSKRTLHRMESVNIENKQFKLVLSMLSLFLSLMLDFDETLSQGSYLEEFMTEFNVLVRD